MEPSQEEINTLITLFNQRRYAEAEPLIRALLVRFPRHGFCHKALGAVLRQQGNSTEALKAMQNALALLPDDAEANYNLAVILKEQRQFADAEASYRNVLEINSNFAPAHNGLGNVLKAQGRLKEAEVSYRQALKIKPDFIDALDNLAQILLARREYTEALGLAIRYLQLEQNSNAKILFVSCVKRAELKQIGEVALGYFIRALSEPWCNPVALISAGVAFVKDYPAIQKGVEQAAKAWPDRLSAQDLFGSSGLAAVAGNPLLATLLTSAPVFDVGLERLFTMVRKTILNSAVDTTGSSNASSAELEFCCALSRQCFINEYVYALTDDEAERSRVLRDALAAAIETEAHIPVLWVVAVAAYCPLHKLPCADRLLHRSWPDAVNAMLVQLVSEPEQEKQLRASIPQLTSVEGEVSLSVQNQYEENPYPRWIKASPAVKPVTVDHYLRQNFPLVSFKPLNKENNFDILIAGCGTGRHSIGTARKFTDSRVLAVDLSLTSLSYAKRKTQELGLSTIDYSQADILKLGLLNRSFDVIESGGVLHHLADPLAGWRVLLSLLRPGGFMGIALYSEVARRDVVKARTFIAEQGYASTVEDIRRCRQDIMDLGANGGFGDLLRVNDFFSISDCRDLLFHVQEHRMTLTGIEAFLRDNNLVFLGFQIDADVLSAYKQRFPDDQTATNLSQWQIFEQEHPNIFFGMYQFWIQKLA